MGENEDKDRIKKELDELKKRNKELEQMIKAVFNRIDKINGSGKPDELFDDSIKTPKRNEIEIQLENDLQKLKKEKETKASEYVDKQISHDKRKIHLDSVPVDVHPKRTIPPAHPLPPERPHPPRRPRPPSSESPRVKHFSLSKEEIARARQEIQRAKEELRKERERIRHEARKKALETAKKSDARPFIFSNNIDLDGFGETITKYVESILASVSKNIEETVKSAFSSEKKGKEKRAPYAFSVKAKGHELTFPFDYRRIPVEEIESYLDEISELLSAIGDKNRLHILKLLELQPEYQKELSEKTGLKGGTFKHHTDILAKNGLITQETVRGRYLITQLGIEALKLAEILYTRKKEIYSSEESSYDDFDEEGEINIDIK